MGHVNPSGGQGPHDQSGPRVTPFGKYLLLDRIAVGGMAEVYTAKSFGIEGFEKIIAIKRILPTMAEDQDFISMFIDEAKIAGHLTHANVVPIYELGKIGDSHYIAMEYVWGKDLLQIMNRFRRMRRHMPPVMAAWIASKVLEGLDYAHRKRDRHGRPMGIIHRDVSPQNVLVSYEGQIKLIDFGIAKAASRNTKTQAGVLKGKFGYMSPEQVRGLPIDHRSDIFAASTCLHEMLTGERLFVGESDFSTLEKVRNAEIAPPSTVVADMPSDLEQIVLKGLAREPEERWQTAGEMQEELQRFIALQRPPFGTSKLNTWMRTAFAPELAKEKARLDSFSKVAHPGGAIPQPRVPPAGPPRIPTAPMPATAFPPGAMPPAASAPDPAALDAFEEDDLVGEATMITASPFDAMEEAQAALAAAPPSGSFEELQEEPTQIFFSADDLEEIVEDDHSGAAGGLPPAGVLPPPAVGFTSTTAPMMGHPTPQAQAHAQPGYAAPTPTPAPQSDMFAAPPDPGPQRKMPTVELDRPAAAPAQRSGGMGKWIAVLAVAALLVVGLSVGGALLFFGADSTGTISIRVAPAGTEARVFVDGVQRGHAPLLLEHVPEGAHTIEVRADGFQTVARQLDVNGGSTAMLELAMESQTVAGAPPTSAAAPAEAVAPAVAAVGAVGAPTEAQPTEAQPTEAPPTEAPPTETQPTTEAGSGAEAIAAIAPPVEAPAPRVAEETPTPAPRPARTESEPAPTRPRRAAPVAAQEDPTPTRPRRVPRAEETPEPAPRASSGSGALTINTMPWARVFVDGRDTGRNTPVRNLRVPAGHHTIGLRTNDGTMHRVETDVPAGETVRIVRQL